MQPLDACSSNDERSKKLRPNGSPRNQHAALWEYFRQASILGDVSPEEALHFSQQTELKSIYTKPAKTVQQRFRIVGMSRFRLFSSEARLAPVSSIKLQVNIYGKNCDGHVRT